MVLRASRDRICLNIRAVSSTKCAMYTVPSLLGNLMSLVLFRKLGACIGAYSEAALCTKSIAPPASVVVLQAHSDHSVSTG